MKKYWLVIKNQLSQVTSYRFEIFGNFVFRLFGFLTFYFIWSLTTNDPAALNKLLVYYFLFSCLFSSFMTSKTGKWFGQAVASGDFSNYLLKPISFPVVNFIRLMSILIARMILPAAVFVAVIIFQPALLAGLTPIRLLLFGIASIMGIILWNIFMVFVGSWSFWVTEIAFTLTVIDLILNFFNGAYIPFYLYPQWLIDLMLLTPIPYTGAFQIMIWQGDLSLQRVAVCLGVLGLWLIILALSANLIYQRGIKKYEAVGN